MTTDYCKKHNEPYTFGNCLECAEERAGMHELKKEVDRAQTLVDMLKKKLIEIDRAVDIGHTTAEPVSDLEDEMAKAMKVLTKEQEVKTWPCEHLVKEPHGTIDGYLWRDDKGSNHDINYSALKFCPSCGTPRPEPKRLRDYKVNISIEPWEGDLREDGNVFTFEQAEVVAEMLTNLRRRGL